MEAKTAAGKAQRPPRRLESSSVALALLQGVVGIGGCRSLVITDDAAFVHEEMARSRRSRDRVCVHRESRRWRAGYCRVGEVITALGLARESCVDLVRATLANRAGVQFGQGCRESDRGASGRVRDFRRGDRTERTNCGRFVCCHFRLNQVRDCDGRDDQNDRHDDQQFDKRKALLFLHLKRLLMRDCLANSARSFWQEQGWFHFKTEFSTLNTNDLAKTVQNSVESRRQFEAGLPENVDVTRHYPLILTICVRKSLRLGLGFCVRRPRTFAVLETRLRTNRCRSLEER